MWRHRVLLAVRWVIVGVYVAAGLAKLASVSGLVTLFAMVGLGQWFRFAVGTYELVGAALLAYSKTALWGAALLIALMIGAVATEILILDRLPFSSGAMLLGLIVVEVGLRGRPDGRVG